MRPRLALLPLLMLAACSLPQQPESRAFTRYAPLQAHITATTASGPLFHVNRPAYVAMFYIVPGSGVSMLYPGFGSGSLDGRVFAGSHFASPRINNREQYIFTAGLSSRPRFYFLIASDRPLNVQQFGAFGHGLQSRLGTGYHSFSAYSTMEDLARLTLPNLGNEGSWTTDMYVDWPSVISREPSSGWVLVRCNGYEMYVPYSRVSLVRQVICEARNDAERRIDREDGEELVRPKTRKPLPPETDEAAERARVSSRKAREALIDRVSSSTQLSEPIGRDALGIGSEIGRTGSRVRPRAGESSGSESRGSVGRGSAEGVTTRASGPARQAPSARPSGEATAAPASRPSSGGTASPSSRPSSGGGGSPATPATRSGDSSDDGG